MESRPGPTESNPYAWDDDFSDIHYSISADEYAYLLLYNKIFHSVTFALGALLSLMMLYLIVKKSGRMLQNYRVMLIFNCLVDMQICLTLFVGQSSTKTVDGMLLVSYEGIGGSFSFTGQCMLGGMFAACVSVAIISLPANYYYRYDCIKRGHPLDFNGLILLYSGVYLATLPPTFGVFYTFNHDGASRPGFNYGTLWFDVKPLPTLLILDFNLKRTKLFIVYVFICFCISYGLAILFAMKTLKILHDGMTKYSQRTIQLQRQLSLAMLAQSVLPIFVSIGPVTVLIIQIVCGLNSDVVTTIAFNAFAMIPVLNSLCTIIAIRPFRDAILRPIFKKSINSVSETQQAKTNNMSG
ncbi:unnamed protein product [Bursaphelenchus xylophilus]|uniref:(pine wood nematode) hypothetical protein n=1 Tax=Bursaphelenchus xylophilus TaxID=6326 RepID=A0A1I7RKG8_BURXY|nr:unnamed protein product [Bursaphelenchus xylophilus]CAG9131333.1 unnamed protein product [Bursaphelenchus xylophilus]